MENKRIFNTTVMNVDISDVPDERIQTATAMSAHVADAPDERRWVRPAAVGAAYDGEQWLIFRGRLSREYAFFSFCVFPCHVYTP